MKQLSIEEKARNYDKAIERANSLLSGNQLGNAWIYKLLPELVESKDEKIKAKLIEFFKGYSPDKEWWGNITQEDILAWLEKQGKNNIGISEATKLKLEDNLNEALEKETPESLNKFLNEQGEQKQDVNIQINTSEYINDMGGNGCYLKNTAQKPADKVKQKFHKGDWVVSPNGVYWHIDAVWNGRYEVSSIDGTHTDWPLNTSLYHLWTIQDAKDGDVLAYDNGCVEIILLFKKWLDEVGKGAYSYVHITSSGRHIHINNWSDCGLSAYPATKEQRELLFSKMIEAGYTWDAENKKLKKEEVDNLHNYLYGEKNSSWSEEDKDYYDAIITKLEVTQEDAALTDNQMNFLKSLKDRVLLQPKQEWSEEDERLCLCLIEDQEEALDKVNNNKYGHSEIISDLKEMYNERISWLKSLKERYTWKPSDEQMKGIECTIKTLKYQLNVGDNRLDSLYNDLKKLRENKL